MSQQLIATRQLVLRTVNGEKLLEVRIYKPERVQNDWAAVFEIDGLGLDGSTYRHQGMQVDSFGALVQAIDLLNSKIRSHSSFASMHWLEAGDECGLRRLGDPSLDSAQG